MNDSGAGRRTTDRPRQEPLVELTRARLLEFAREPGAIFWVFIFPILLAVGLGIAFRSRPEERYRVAVTEARVADLLKPAKDLDMVVSSPDAAREALRTAKVDLIVVATSSAAFTYHFDPTQPKSKLARLLAREQLEIAAGRADRLEAGEELMTEPGGRYIDFLVPGLIGLNLMGSSMWGIGYAVVQARTRKLMKRFAATPMRRSHFLLSFILSRFVFLFLEVMVLVVFAHVVFDVVVHGSYLDLGLIAAVGATSFAGIALLVAARPQSVESASGWMNFVMLPMWLLSGSFFSYSRFPEWIQPAIRALPLTALNDALRVVMNDGAPIWSAWIELSVLGTWAVVGFVIALKIFRWK